MGFNPKYKNITEDNSENKTQDNKTVARASLLFILFSSSPLFSFPLRIKLNKYDSEAV